MHGFSNYFVSKCGKILSIYNNKFKILKPKTTQDGYNEVVLIGDDGKRNNLRVHRVVALTFISNNENKPHVNHINGDRVDNNVNNLEWATIQENNLHSYKNLGRKPTCSKLINIFKEGKLIDTLNITHAVNKYNISRKYLYEMISNKEKSYHYMYFERNKDSVTIYYNGEIYKEFNATKDVADFFNKQVNTISTKINKNKRDEEIFTRYHNVREA
jgi:hypothetical protein